MPERRHKRGDSRWVTIEAPVGVGTMRRGREEAGRRVREAALAWLVAERLQNATGIRCQALVGADIHAVPDKGWAADPLTVVVEETSVSRRRKDRLVIVARQTGARLVLACGG